MRTFSPLSFKRTVVILQRAVGMPLVQPPLPASPLKASHQVIRGVGRGSLCFSRSSPAHAIQLAADNVLDDVWSPVVQRCPKSLEHIFSTHGLAAALSDCTDEAREFEKQEEHESVCVICIEECDNKSSVLRCPQCSMEAHARCLGRWFSSKSQSRSTDLPKSYAMCPGCRKSLDWDALALQSRRKRMPFGSMVNTNVQTEDDF
jgi:hypothetical protein